MCRKLCRAIARSSASPPPAATTIRSSTSVFPLGGALVTSPFAQNFYSRTIGANGTYTLFNGFQTANRTRQAESQVDAARETLRVTEQQVLLDAATAYMNLLRDQAVLDLQRRNVEVLTEQLKQTRDRFNVGEVTRTDVAQAESRLAAGRSQLLAAQSQYVTSRANYRRVIGVDPGTLAAGTPVDRLSPNVLARAIAQGQAQSPSVLAAAYGVDVAELAVKISEGALYPNLTVTGSVLQGQNPAFEVIRLTQLSAVAQLSVPIYQGGGEYSAVRQSKETLGQQRLNLDVNRDQARATVVQSWGQLDAAKAQIESTTAQVNAAEIALNGVREEARVGQRTTLDVLNAQQELVNARVALVTAQHDRVVAPSLAEIALNGVREEARVGQRTLDVLNAQQSCERARALSPSTIAWSPLTPCSRRSVHCRCRGSVSTSRSTTRWCITSRCATPGWACAILTPNRSRATRRQTLLQCADRSMQLRSQPHLLRACRRWRTIRRTTAMLGHFVFGVTILTIVPSITWARSNEIPKLDVRPVCRGIASQSADPGVGQRNQTETFQQCMESEQAVREQLKQEWSAFSAADKRHCVTLATTGGEFE